MTSTESPIIKEIERRAGAAPGSPAVTDGSGTTTFGRLWDDASACAAFLAPYGGGGAAIGLCFSNGAPFVAALLGVARNGSAAILLPTGLGVMELRTYCREAAAAVLLTSADHRSLLEAAGGRLRRWGPAGMALFAMDARAGDQLQAGDFIGQLTSGVDDPSKVAVRTHAAVWAEIQGVAEAVRLTAADATFVLSAISHSYGLVGGTLAPLCRGARVILGDRRFPEEALRTARRERPTILFAVPVTYQALADGSAGARGDLSSLRLCLCAGASLPRDVDEEFTRRYGLRIGQDYGTTEVGTISLRLEWSPQRAGSVGRPLPHVSVAIADPDGRSLPAGRRGEVIIQSPALARRYLGTPPEASAGLRGNCLSSGDLGWLDDEGYLFLADRKTSLIYVEGAAVDPVEVESVISRLPGVREVAVVGVPGAQPAERLKAVVVADGLTATCIQQHCRAHLRVCQVPEIIEFRDAIPRTPAGKILRRVLRSG